MRPRSMRRRARARARRRCRASCRRCGRCCGRTSAARPPGWSRASAGSWYVCCSGSSGKAVCLVMAHGGQANATACLRTGPAHRRCGAPAVAAAEGRSRAHRLPQPFHRQAPKTSTVLEGMLLMRGHLCFSALRTDISLSQPGCIAGPTCYQTMHAPLWGSPDTSRMTWSPARPVIISIYIITTATEPAPLHDARQAEGRFNW